MPSVQAARIVTVIKKDVRSVLPVNAGSPLPVTFPASEPISVLGPKTAALFVSQAIPVQVPSVALLQPAMFPAPVIHIVRMLLTVVPLVFLQTPVPAMSAALLLPVTLPVPKTASALKPRMVAQLVLTVPVKFLLPAVLPVLLKLNVQAPKTPATSAWKAPVLIFPTTCANATESPPT